MLQWLMRRQVRPVKEERRTSSRRPVSERVNERLVVEVGPSAWPAYVEDISTHGIGIVLGIRQEPGTLLYVRLVNRYRRVAYPLQAEVVHTERREDGYWYSGCVFQGSLAPDDLKALL